MRRIGVGMIGSGVVVTLRDLLHYQRLLHLAQPVSPGDVAIVDKDGLVVTMVSDGLEEEAASQKRELERSDIDVGAVFVPGPGADCVRDDGGNSTVEVEEEEESQDAADNQVDEKEPVEASLFTQGRRGKAVACHVRSMRYRAIMLRL